VDENRAGQVRLDERELTRAVVDALAGGAGEHQAVVWATQGSEVVLHLDSVGVRLTRGGLLVQLDCETDETGRVPQLISLALPLPGEPPNFVAATELAPGGDVQLANRWGPALQDAVWAAVIRVARTDAGGVAADRGTLIVHGSPPSAASPSG
jgi:hypothetical protein